MGALLAWRLALNGVKEIVSTRLPWQSKRSLSSRNPTQPAGPAAKLCEREKKREREKEREKERERGRERRGREKKERQGKNMERYSLLALPILHNNRGPGPSRAEECY